MYVAVRWYYDIFSLTYAEDILCKAAKFVMQLQTSGYLQDAHQHLTPMWTGTMLEDINPLPCAQGQNSRIYRDRQAGIRQHSADVGSGVVGTFQVVGVPAISFRDEALHESLQVGAGGWVPVFADDQ